jgi:dynein heavy chain
MLDEITKALQEYMERKRSEFPRFYFLSDDELLDILANSDKVQEVIMLHLKTLFDNLVYLDISDGEIFKMHSREKEVCAFTKAVKLKSEVQAWLLDVQREMMFTIQRRMKDGYKAYTDAGRKAWTREHPGQVVAVVAQIMWSQSSEEAIN